MDSAVKNTWKPVVAGVFDIIIGCLILMMLFLFGICGMIIEPVEADIFGLSLKGYGD